MRKLNSNKAILRSVVVSGAMLASTLCWGGSVIDLSINANSVPEIRTMAEPLVNQSTSQGPFAQGNQDIPPKVFGKTYGEWAAEWVKWGVASKAAAIIDTTGASCGVNQPNSGVWFLAGTFLGTPSADRTCAIPPNRMLFYPLVEQDWVDCPNSADLLLTDAEVRAILSGGLDLAGELTSTVDGVAVAGLQMLTVRAQSPKFASIVPPNFNLDTCVPHLPAGKTGRAIVDGYWVMLPPLSSGRHELTLHGALIFPDLSRLETGATYHLTVRAGGH
jgi:hypothetical protein